MPDISIGRLRGGYCAIWRDDAGKRHRHQLKALDRKTAEAEAIDIFRRQAVQKELTAIADLWTAYRDHLGSRPTAKTMSYTGKAILAHFGALRPDQITVQDCRRYVALRTKSGRKAGAIWTELGHLSSCLKWAAKLNLISRAPYIERPQKPAPKDRFLTHAEIDRLLLADCEPHIRLAILLMLATAGRVSAILDLTWDRVDLDAGRIDLRIDTEGPRKGRAVVPINASLKAALITASEGALSDYVVEWNGSQVRSIRKGFARAVERADLEGVSPHVLRHTAGVHMAAGGIPLQKIAQYLGHSNTGMTERVYARYAPDHLADAAAILDFGNLRKVP
jgi:integrase